MEHTTTTTMATGISAVETPVYFLVTMLQGVSLGYDMRGDFPAHSRGTRNLATARQWRERLEAENSDLRGHLHIMATDSFVLNESAPLSVI
jgi:hypothetical protein